MAETVPSEPLESPTLHDIRSWPASVDIPMAATAFGISRSHAYELVARGVFPAKVIQIGNRYKVITESIVRALSAETV
ncbi:helix-turn-helix transcriptional regulator [Lentzea sp. JNUCC 0626]|uniref:helix-turn-helix transcriptional regulator n=1 Tax=Lentzea sp. JNUCC 0626 TaxID=3367513 RepID=UPI00374A4728